MSQLRTLRVGSDWSEEEGLTSWFAMQAGIEIAKLFLAGGETVCFRASHLQILLSVSFVVHVESKGPRDKLTT